MSLADSLADDFKITDDTETVTLVSKNASQGDTSVTVNFADWHELSSKEVAAANGLFQSGDRRVSLGNNQIPAANKPKPGDEVVAADSSRWEVLDAALDDFGISWVCTTRKAR